MNNFALQKRVKDQPDPKNGSAWQMTANQLAVNIKVRISWRSVVVDRNPTELQLTLTLMLAASWFAANWLGWSNPLRFDILKRIFSSDSSILSTELQ